VTSFLVRSVVLLLIGGGLISCADAPREPDSGADPPASPGSASPSTESDFKELRCPVDTAAQGVVGEIFPTAKGESSPESALDAYFSLENLPLESTGFATVAEVEGLVQLAWMRDEKIEALASVVQVESGGWVVSEFSACRGFVHDDPS
jgi:hypothetical protein